MSKSKIIVSLLVLPMFLSSGAAFAEEVILPVEPEVVIPNVATETNTVVSETKLDKIKAKGAKLLSERIRILGQLKGKITKSKLLDTQKTALNTQIDDRVTKLTALAATIKAGTNASTTRQEVSSIFTDYRIYAVFIPQIHYERSLYALTNYATKLDQVFTKAQASIDAAKAKGKDVTTVQANLDKAKALKAEAVAQIASSTAKVLALKPSDYPTVSKPAFIALKAEVKSIQDKFKSIRQSIMAKRIDSLKAIKAKILKAVPKADHSFTTLPASSTASSTSR